MALVLKLLLSSVLGWLGSYFSLEAELILNIFILIALPTHINSADFNIFL